MFGLFKKDPLKKMEKQYLDLLEEAMQIQRKGDIKGYSEKIAQADALQKQMEEEKKKQARQ